MESIRRIKIFDVEKSVEPSITKTGKIRKKYERKSPVILKKWSLNVALSEDHKDFLEKEATKLNVKPTEIIRALLNKEIMLTKDT